jgi:hypothetical protein
MRRGWFFGSQKFREKLLKLASGKLRERAGKKSDGYHGEEVRDHGEQRARELLQAGLENFQTTQSELCAARKSDWRKCLLAELIQVETTMRLDWISGELGMGTRSWCGQQICQTRIRLGKDRKLRKRRNAIKND